MGTILIDSHVAPRSELLIVIVILAFAFLAPRDPRMQETPPAIIIKFVACPKEQRLARTYYRDGAIPFKNILLLIEALENSPIKNIDCEKKWVILNKNIIYKTELYECVLTSKLS